MIARFSPYLGRSGHSAFSGEAQSIAFAEMFCCMLRQKKLEVDSMAKEKKKAIIDENASAEDIMRQFDRESATRIWVGIPQRVVRYVMSVFFFFFIW